MKLLGYDPEENPQLALPHNCPQVTFAYTKYLWAMDQKQRAYQQLEHFINDYTQYTPDVDISQEDRQRLLAR